MHSAAADSAVNRRVLITGANGFLGRHVARLFAEKGYSVVGIGHGDWAPAEWQQWGLSEWHCDDVTLDVLEQYAGSPAAIIHCAGSGSVGFALQRPLEDFQRTVVTTAQVLEYVRSSSPATRVVYPSSASVYGVVEKVPIREDARTAPISQYGVHKLMAEDLVRSYGQQFALSASIVRLFSVYGNGLRKQLLWDACAKFASGSNVFMGTGEEVRDWLHVEDAATLLLAAMENATPSCPTVNGGSGLGVTVREVVSLLDRTLHAEPLVPEFSGRAREGDPSIFVADMTAVSQWGWQPKSSWQQGIAGYAAWWRRSL